MLKTKLLLYTTKYLTIIWCLLQVGLSILRALLYMARPGVYKLGRIPDSKLYRDLEQYPSTDGVPGILILQMSSHIYFANASYSRERWIYANTHFI